MAFVAKHLAAHQATYLHFFALFLLRFTILLQPDSLHTDEARGVGRIEVANLIHADIIKSALLVQGVKES